MGGATRDGCSKLSQADDETSKTCFNSGTEPNKELCAHCNLYKVLTKNITKKLHHISVCTVFNSRCCGEDMEARSMDGFRIRAIMACDGYKGSSSALEAKSELKYPCTALVLIARHEY